MKNINGYRLAARLCQFSPDGGVDEIDFPEFCIDFGPGCWDQLSTFQKYYFKRLAQYYKTTTIGQNEKRDGVIPTKQELFTVLFHERPDEQNCVIELLRPYADQLINGGGV